MAKGHLRSLLFATALFGCTGPRAAIPLSSGGPTSDILGDGPGPKAMAEPSPTPTTLAGRPQGPLAKTPGSAATPPSSPSPPPPPSFAQWLTERLPPGGTVESEPSGTLSLRHTASRGDTPSSVARSYLDFTNVYTAGELAEALAKTHHLGTHAPFRTGQVVAIPFVLDAIPPKGDEARLGWPEDQELRGIFLRNDKGREFPDLLERLAARGMNAIVLDGKDYEGYITYPTQVAVARTIKAAHRAPIRDLARLVRFAHAKGIRIVMRNSCFHDPWTAKALPHLSVQSKDGRPYPLQWVDPSKEEMHEYILALVKEQLDAGVDEIQLDYVRYPVQGIQGADFHLAERGLTQGKVIHDFVRKVHALTQAHRTPLSLDVFGVVAWNRPVDVEPLGQDLTVLGAECEALSPMVYPSHFAPGFRGFDLPGNHPEVIEIATRATVDILAKAGLKTLVRPWLQAFAWHAPDYGPEYLAAETRHASQGGGRGWLMWNPGGDYATAWRALPPVGPGRSSVASLPTENRVDGRTMAQSQRPHVPR